MKQGAADTGARLSVTAHENDNVATLLDDRSTWIEIAGGITVSAGVPFGHKIALKDIVEGGEVIKYGVVIGLARTSIRSGEHVHVHNIE
jgi:altronate dehydratase